MDKDSQISTLFLRFIFSKLPLVILSGEWWLGGIVGSLTGYPVM